METIHPKERAYLKHALFHFSRTSHLSNSKTVSYSICNNYTCNNSYSSYSVLHYCALQTTHQIKYSIAKLIIHNWMFYNYQRVDIVD